MLTFTFFLWFLGLRLFFTFQITQAPCVESLVTFGKGNGLPSVFKMLFYITGLLGIFWVCVVGLRTTKARNSLAQRIWHFSQFIAIFFLATGFWTLTPSGPINAPNGWMTVALSHVDSQNPDFFWLNDQGEWETYGHTVCVWKDEGYVNDGPPQFDRHEISEILGLGRPNQNILNLVQNRRLMTDLEKQTFERIEACVSKIENYGKPYEYCRSNRYRIKTSPDQAAYLNQKFPYGTTR